MDGKLEGNGQLATTGVLLVICRLMLELGLPGQIIGFEVKFLLMYLGRHCFLYWK